MNPTEIVEAVRKAGVVGAGGAGFPTHVKLSANVGFAIANGVECEPILAHDKFVMSSNPGGVVKGLDLLALAVGAKKKYIALKKKYSSVGDILLKHGADFEIFLMDDYYPAGDEIEIVREITGSIIPEAGLPLDIGAVVNNVETLINIADAVEGRPVTRRTITVCGEINKPSVVRVPIGIKIKDVISLCGGAKVENFAVYTGGPMMGMREDPENPVTKTTTGIFVLPVDHYLIQVRSIRIEHIIRQAQAACTDCKLCTEVCPRYLLGHAIEPHKIMRTVSLQLKGMNREVLSAFLCCFCGACEYACPMWLSPRRVYEQTRDFLLEEGVEFPKNEHELVDNPNRMNRRIPSARLLSRMGLSKYNIDMKMLNLDGFVPDEVHIPLKQHIGEPAVPVVSESDRVAEGEMIGEISEDKLSARIHSSIDGTITRVTNKMITVRAK